MAESWPEPVPWLLPVTNTRVPPGLTATEKAALLPLPGPL